MQIVFKYISSNHLSHERMIGFNLVCRTLVHTALGFQPFPAKPMYRFGAWIALVICQLPCTALRTIQNNLDQACPVEAAPTHGDAQTQKCVLKWVSQNASLNACPQGLLILFIFLQGTILYNMYQGCHQGRRQQKFTSIKRFVEVICAMPIFVGG